MTNKEFCRLHSEYNGERISDIRQLVSETLTGEELKEFVEFCIDQSKLHQPTVISQRKLLKKFWKYFDEECVAVNCNDEERNEVINDFFNSL